jgi:protein phosphatase
MTKGGQQRPASGGSKKSKKDDSEEFQAFCSQLQNATKKKAPAPHSSSKAGEASSAQSQGGAVNEKNNQQKKMEASAGHPLEKMLEQQQRQRQLQAFIQTMMAQQRSMFLPAPDTNFHPESKSGRHFSAAAGSMQGWRISMEDSHILDVDFLGNEEGGREGCGLFAVFDGHAGAKCAAMNKALMPVFAKKHYDEQKKDVDFTKAFVELDNAMRSKGLPDGSGSTAVAVFVSPTRVTCASVGDSRALLCRGGRTIALSEDHKPENAGERERILAAGGHVENNRVNGQLAMSRALGDYQYKSDASRQAHEQLVSHIPDIVSLERTKEDSFVVVACDGIFDVLENEAVVDFVQQQLTIDPTQELTAICEKLIRLCLAPAGANGQPARAGGTDNMTVVITKLL